MKVFGLDFTSAPRPQKPITCVVGEQTGARLQISHPVISLTDFAAFEAFLARPGPWIAGLDFPFGQPRRLIEALGWPQTWPGYVARVDAMTMLAFEETLAAYRQSRPAGDKHHLRATDKPADARSPMMLYGVPVGKMFFRGAPRLLKAAVNILPCRPTADNRIVVEAYPALLARRWIGRRSYKSDTKQKQTPAREAARTEIVQGIRSPGLRHRYGFQVELSNPMAQRCIQDPTGDTLDALLCAVQAAWAYTQRANNYGLPATCDPLEGWIVDPHLA
jgi:hypothetical protein